MLYYRHPNGGGLVAETATVDASVYLSRGVWIRDEARIFGHAVLIGTIEVCGNAIVGGGATVLGVVSITGEAMVLDSAMVSGDDIQISGNITICGTTEIYGNCRLNGRGLFVDTMFNFEPLIALLYFPGTGLVSTAQPTAQPVVQPRKPSVLARLSGFFRPATALPTTRKSALPPSSCHIPALPPAKYLAN